MWLQDQTRRRSRRSRSHRRLERSLFKNGGRNGKGVPNSRQRNTESPQNRKRRLQRVQKQTTSHLQKLRRKKPNQCCLLHQMRRKTRVRRTPLSNRLTFTRVKTAFHRKPTQSYPELHPHDAPVSFETTEENLSRDDPILNTRDVALLTLKNQAELSKKSTKPTCFNNVLTLKEITD